MCLLSFAATALILLIIFKERKGQGAHRALSLEKMAVFKQIPEAEIRAKFTHVGWFVGLVPVYLGAVESDCPDVVVRNWVVYRKDFVANISPTLADPALMMTALGMTPARARSAR